MIAGGSGGSGSALRALRAASTEVDRLRREPGGDEQARGYVLRVANAVDRALRRLLRDDEAAELSIRLSALAPDELRGDEVLAELRRNEKLPVELAAAIHELLEIRRRLERGGAAGEAEARRAVRVYERLERELEELSASRHEPPPPPPAEWMPGGEWAQAPEDAFDSRPARREKRRGPPSAVWLTAGALALLLVVGALWLSGTRERVNHMEQGVALFRSGAYEDAAHHFWRYAEANPQDPTPHLYLARIHRRLERPELAAEALRVAQRLAPEDAAVHRELGFLLLDRNQPEVAVERFQHALELEPASSEGWIGLVRALREAGRMAEMERALAEAPAEVRALLNHPDAGP